METNTNRWHSATRSTTTQISSKLLCSRASPISDHRPKKLHSVQSAGIMVSEMKISVRFQGFNFFSTGTNLPGPRIKYYTTTQEGSEQHGGSSQLPQSAYFSLHLPYTIFGLGRTPNFVDFVEIGLAKKSRSWPQVIPNSQIFVIPSPPNKPENWKIQLFVTPSKIILKSVIALFGICLVILLIILGLHIKERREDKLEKLQEAQRFHFDAM